MDNSSNEGPQLEKDFRSRRHSPHPLYTAEESNVHSAHAHAWRTTAQYRRDQERRHGWRQGRPLMKMWLSKRSVYHKIHGCPKCRNRAALSPRQRNNRSPGRRFRLTRLSSCRELAAFLRKEAPLLLQSPVFKMPSRMPGRFDT